MLSNVQQFILNFETNVFYEISKTKKAISKGEKPGLVVRAEGSRPRGHGFESCRILDGCKQC